MSAPNSGGAMRPLVAWIRTVIAALLAVTTLLTPASAAAQSTSLDERGEPQLIIEAADTWIQPGERFAARVAISDAPTAATLDVRLHPAVTGRIEFAATLRGEQLKTPVTVLDPLNVRDIRSRLAVIPGAASADGPSRAPGVYPVSITLRSGDGEPLAQMVTHLIQLGEDNADFPPLAVGVLFDLGATADDGIAPLTAAEHAAALSTVGTVAVDHPTIPVTLRIDPRRLADERAPAELISAVSVARLVPETFVLANPGDWSAAELDLELDEQRSFANQVMVDQLGREPDSDVVVIASRPDQLSRDWHRSRGAIGLITNEGALEPLNAAQFPVTVARPFALSDADDLVVLTIDPQLRSALSAGPGSEPEVAVTTADSVVAAADGASTPAELARRRLETTVSPVEGAHRIMAELAVIWAEQPARRRGIVLSPPANQAPSGALLETLFGQLDKAPTIVEPIDLGRLFTDVPRAEVGDGLPLIRTVEPGRIEPLAELAAGLAQSDALLASYGGFVGTDAPRLQPLRRQQLDAGDSRLDATGRRRLFDTISATISADLGGVSLPDGQRITLTSRTAEVPLTIRKERSGPVTVKLSFSSQKLDFPDGPDRTIELVDDQTELTLPVEARASGEFPLEIIATSPDGQLEIASASLTVRSTAFSGVGLLLSGGALAFLVVWWTRNALARRRDQDPADAEAPTAATPDPDPEADTDTGVSANGYGDDAVSLPNEPRNKP